MPDGPDSRTIAGAVADPDRAHAQARAHQVRRIRWLYSASARSSIRAVTCPIARCAQPSRAATPRRR